MNEDHICQARHKRRPRQSQTQTSRQRWGSGGPLALHVQRILGGWLEFAYLKIAVRGRKVGVWVPGEQKGPSSGGPPSVSERGWGRVGEIFVQLDSGI